MILLIRFLHIYKSTRTENTLMSPDLFSVIPKMKFAVLLSFLSGVCVFANAVPSTPSIDGGSLEKIMLTLSRIEESTRKSCPSAKPSSCAELFLQGNVESGVYDIYPKPWFNKNIIKVYCDMTTDGGGWTVFQRRDDYEVQENFYRDWSDYRRGFGKVEKDFWLGNDNLYALTNQDYVSLRVDMEDFEGRTRHAVYGTFKIASWLDRFRLNIGGYAGDAGNNLALDNITFVTLDDGDVNKCSEMYKGGWWYTKCHGANLNGLYLRGNHSSYANGVNWNAFRGYHYSLKKVEMKVRPTKFKNCDEAV